MYLLYTLIFKKTYDNFSILIYVKGLKSIASWRTFMTGIVVGYMIAWGIHWSSQFSTLDGHWVEEYIPFLTPSFGRRGD